MQQDHTKPAMTQVHPVDSPAPVLMRQPSAPNPYVGVTPGLAPQPPSNPAAFQPEWPRRIFVRSTRSDYAGTSLSVVGPATRVDAILEELYGLHYEFKGACGLRWENGVMLREVSELHRDDVLWAVYPGDPPVAPVVVGSVVETKDRYNYRLPSEDNPLPPEAARQYLPPKKANCCAKLWYYVTCGVGHHLCCGCC
eukprot:gnl/Hemi2/23242_TR7796_c0_g1_i1.p1 gnl/Hemi2/23242_TR7796_c0_g1~~gnl/Hemi2/23242_TR7796_c0_g1_i1.p1  ORF type:complete len:196 (+),score=16.91 gnl/Hemi2/23242_TR7796_c0_g1_i1:96-683(+)